MLKVITPFIVENRLNGQYRMPNNDPIKDTIATHEFIKKLDGNYDVEKIANFLVRGPQYAELLTKLLPLPVILSMYHDMNILRAYFDKDMIDNLTNMNYDTVYYKALHGEDCSDHIINLNDHIGQYYSFNEPLIRKRYNTLKEKLTVINLDDFIMGLNGCLYLGTKQDIKIIKIYPKRANITFNGEVFKAADGYFFEEKGLSIIISSKYYTRETLLLDGVQMVYENGHIYTIYKYYANLESKIEPIEHQIYRRDKKLGRLLQFRKSKLQHHVMEGFCYLISGRKSFRQCYVCKKFYNYNCYFEKYQCMCMDCGIFNHNKREEVSDLRDMVAYVSGCRTKIGLATVLKLLRMGATVYGSTRFPNLAVFNYMSQSDYDQWKARLIILQCDFLNYSEVEAMLDYLKDKGINILINNACQTIRPPDSYFKKIYEYENNLEKQLIFTKETVSLNESPKDQLIPQNSKGRDFIICLIKESASEQIAQLREVIQLDKYMDVVGAIDPRDMIWNKKLEETDDIEILEINVINQIIPTKIIKTLKPCMKGPKFIINVTAVEGKFNHRKVNGDHVPNNMSKAAIAMMLHTMFREKDSDLYVHTIDPGYVSGINPSQTIIPLDPIDGASRILDPIIQFKKGSPYPKVINWVKLKDYKPDAY